MAISLTHIQEQLRPQLDVMNEIITNTLTSNSELTNNIVTSYLKSKGKMLRPIVTLLSAMQNHLGLDALSMETLVNAHHRQLDDIGSSALDGSIDGVALAETSYHGIPRVNVGQHAATAIECRHITLFTGLGNAAVDIVTHLRDQHHSLRD